MKYEMNASLYDAVNVAIENREVDGAQCLRVVKGEAKRMRFDENTYARLRGVILNHRNVLEEEEKVRAFADARGLEIVGEIPRSDDITRWEDQGRTTIEGDPSLPVSRTFLDLARKLWGEGL